MKIGIRSKFLRILAVTSLGAAAIGMGVGTASAAGTGPATNGCYGQYWNTAWAQKCGTKGATAAGYYKSTADCTAPEIPDKHLERYRAKSSKHVYSGTDCMFGIHNVLTWYRSA